MLDVTDSLFKLFASLVLQLRTLDELRDLDGGEQKAPPEAEARKLSARPIAAQLAVAHLQQVADFGDFQNRHPAKHITMPFHIGNILTDIPNDFKYLFRTFHKQFVLSVAAAKMARRYEVFISVTAY